MLPLDFIAGNFHEFRSQFSVCMNTLDGSLQTSSEPQLLLCCRKYRLFALVTTTRAHRFQPQSSHVPRPLRHSSTRRKLSWRRSTMCGVQTVVLAETFGLSSNIVQCSKPSVRGTSDGECRSWNVTPGCCLTYVSDRFIL